MKKMLSLTALLLGSALIARGEGEGAGVNTGNDGRLTEAEWEARYQTKHAQSTHAELIKALAAAERRAEKLEGSQVPTGGRALTEAEAKDYEAYLQLGKPSEVKTKLEQGDKDGKDLTELRTTTALTSAATDSGFKASILGDRVKADELTVLPSKEVERDGKKVKVAMVKDKTGAEHELAEYAKKNWGDYLPALQASGTQTNTNTSGAEFGGQDSARSAGSGGGSWVQESLKKQSAKSTEGGYTDPLQPQKATA